MAELGLAELGPTALESIPGEPKSVLFYDRKGFHPSIFKKSIVIY